MIFQDLDIRLIWLWAHVVCKGDAKILPGGVKKFMKLQRRAKTHRNIPKTTKKPQKGQILKTHWDASV